MADSTNSDDEPSEVSKLSYSDLLFLYHGVNGSYERLKDKYNKLESRKNSLLEFTSVLELMIQNIERINSECDKCQKLNEEIIRSKTKIESLENKILDLKRKDETKRESVVNRCTSLLNENNSPRSKVQQLELMIRKFSNSEKSLKMLLNNQITSKER